MAPGLLPLFVYGTLMRGRRRHDLLDGCDFLGPATTAEPMILVDCGGYPALLRGTDGSSVWGELYAVPPERIPALDHYEGVSSGEYIRVWINVSREPDGTALPAQAYLYARNASGLPVVGPRWSRAAEQ